MEEIVKPDEPLSQHTWMRLGGPAKYFIEPGSVEQLSEVVRRCRDNEVPVYVLGAGANLLVDDAGVNGAVVRLAGAFREVTFDASVVGAGAAAEMGKIVLRCVREGLSGLECLTGIPGSVGGCTRMNAGGAFGDIGNAVESVEVMSDEGKVFTRQRDDLAFGYRSANIDAKFILNVSFGLNEDDPHRILKQVKQIWIYKKNTQPLGAGSAGCIFKNPRGLSAGALIDQAGLKGRSVGDAAVSDKHANFIIAGPRAKTSDVLKLINIIQEAVYKRFEVYLELEVEVW
ncbi:MAG: UDP-N-acetylmuramate dehydrogenase [Planctomycetota bacterium]|nr:UDP-N-acetylmuramate dehydrogenase [Planctomycetota bacterium]